MQPQPFQISNVSVRSGRDDSTDGEEYEFDTPVVESSYDGAPVDTATRFQKSYETAGLQPSVGQRPVISYKKGTTLLKTPEIIVERRPKKRSKKINADTRIKEYQRPSNRKRVVDFIEEKFEEYSEVFVKDDIKKLLSSRKKVEEVSFPLFIFICAIIKDLLEIPAELSIVGIIFTTISSLFFSVILLFWTYGKSQGGWWKKKIIGWLWKRYIAMVIIEILPFFKIIPATTIYIFMVYNREKKVVKMINSILEELHALGKFDEILKR